MPARATLLSRFVFSLRTKIVAAFAVATLLPLAGVGIVSYRSSYNALQSHMTAAAGQITEQLTTNIELIFRDAERFLKIGNHNTTLAFLNPHGLSEEQTYRSALEILDLFKLFRNIYEFDERIKGIYIIGFNGNNIGERNGRFALHEPLETLEIVREVSAYPTGVVYLPQTRAPYAPAIDALDVISIAKAIIRPVTREFLGLIVVDVDAASVRDLCRNISVGYTGRFSVVTPERHFIYPVPEPADLGVIGEPTIQTISWNQSGHLVDRIAGQDELFVFDTFERAGWKVVGRVPLADIMEGARQIKRVTIAVIAAILCLTIVVYFFISDVLVHPLLDLKQKMRDAETGDLSVRAECSNRDEVADLCRSFNVMIEQVRMLLERSVREEEIRKKSELKALQAQINPHFLYNTLDAIVWMAEANRTTDVVRITKALSGFFRTALSKGREWITLGEEREHIENYLQIQKMRHRDVLHYRCDFDPAILRFSILKLLLQPLVENAIEHGIKRKRGGGTVELRGHLNSEGEIVLEVIDDGGGISPERLEQVRGEIARGTDAAAHDHGFGLANTHQRIRLYYGAQWGLTIDGAPGRGTHTTIRIPARVETV